MPGATLAEELRTANDRGGRPPAGDPGGRGDGWGGGGRAGTPRRAYYTGLVLGLGTILMFFLALVSAYIVRKGLGGDWRATQLPPVLWLNTGVLAASSVTLEAARRSFRQGEAAGFARWWLAGLLLGIGFLAGQLVAWRQLAAQGVYLASNASSSFFYVFTAAHGLHLVGGLCALLYVAARGWSHLLRTDGLAAGMAAAYWHFMDGLWVFLLLLLYFGR